MINMKRITYSSNYIYHIINTVCILLLLLITFLIEKSSNYIIRPIIESRQCDRIYNVTINREILYGSMLNGCFIKGFGNDIFYGNNGNDVLNGDFGSEELVVNSQ